MELRNERTYGSVRGYQVTGIPTAIGIWGHEP